MTFRPIKIFIFLIFDSPKQIYLQRPTLMGRLYNRTHARKFKQACTTRHSGVVWHRDRVTVYTRTVASPVWKYRTRSLQRIKTLDINFPSVQYILWCVSLVLPCTLGSSQRAASCEQREHPPSNFSIPASDASSRIFPGPATKNHNEPYFYQDAITTTLLSEINTHYVRIFLRNFSLGSVRTNTHSQPCTGRTESFYASKFRKFPRRADNLKFIDVDQVFQSSKGHFFYKLLLQNYYYEGHEYLRKNVSIGQYFQTIYQINIRGL